jgi:hypothetical protein
MKHRVITFIAMLFASQANAGLINWSFQGTFTTDFGGDVLAVAGESLTINFVFDDTSIWTDVGGNLYIPSISESYSITGAGNTVIGNTSPAYATIIGAGFAGSFTETLGSLNYFDLVINGVRTVTANGFRPVAIAPNAGDTLKIDHLQIDPFGSFAQILDLNFTTSYLLDNASITITQTEVSEPSILALFALTLMGIALRRTKNG